MGKLWTCVGSRHSKCWSRTSLPLLLQYDRLSIIKIFWHADKQPFYSDEWQMCLLSLSVETDSYGLRGNKSENNLRRSMSLQRIICKLSWSGAESVVRFVPPTSPFSRALTVPFIKADFLVDTVGMALAALHFELRIFMSLGLKQHFPWSGRND